MSLEKQLAYEAEKGDIEKVRSSLKEGADVNYKSYYDETPLHSAVIYGHTEIAKLLLDKEANIEASYYSKTPLHYAAEYGRTEIAQWLLDERADAEAKINNHQVPTPLHEAAMNGHTGVAELLLKHGVNVDVENCYGETPLHKAVNNGHTKIVRLLLKYGASIKIRDFLGEIPLHGAAYRGYIEIVWLLLENGVNVNAKDNKGKTPLRQAAERDRTEIVVLLLIYGAILHDDTKHIINNSSKLKKCFTAFKQIKAMPHLGKLIEANTKKEGAKTIASYINNEAEGQKLIEEFKTIKEKYSSDEQLSFVPEHMLDFVEHITIKFLKFHTDNKKAIKLLLEQKDDIKITKAVLVDSKITDKTRDEYERLPNEIIQEISSYSNLNELNFDNALLALNEKADVFLSELKNVYQSPSTALAASQPEVVSGQCYIK
ncbi:ankyrin repeat domain-containing protein [Candidatus Mesenet endosymbiont of Phosphuga atrata]|uniref:ankyrin repeat domain-containing protein n=1 Tax=Candidatus Mesenet endosymbiont of Phosphuga atrata TaxID=3066221 RepID=UPI0030D354F5